MPRESETVENQSHKVKKKPEFLSYHVEETFCTTGLLIFTVYVMMLSFLLISVGGLTLTLTKQRYGTSAGFVLEDLEASKQFCCMNLGSYSLNNLLSFVSV